jgi:molecular chaperone DnaJ
MRTTTPCGQCQGTGQIIETPCPTCRARGLELTTEKLTVTIPAGVEDESALRVTGKGSDGTGGGRPGDLYVVVNVAHDPRFDRHGRDLLTHYDMTFAQAVIGDTVQVEGLNGPIDASIGPGTQPGAQVRVKGEGLPRLNGTSRGDLVVQFNLAVPKKLGENETELLRKFAELRGEPMPKGPEATGFLGGLFGKKKK